MTPSRFTEHERWISTATIHAEFAFHDSFSALLREKPCCGLGDLIWPRSVLRLCRIVHRCISTHRCRARCHHRLKHQSTFLECHFFLSFKEPCNYVKSRIRKISRELSTFLNETIYVKISNLKRETISFFVRISINPRTCAYVTPE